MINGSPRISGFNPRQAHVGFVVDKGIGASFSTSTSAFLCQLSHHKYSFFYGSTVPSVSVRASSLLRLHDLTQTHPTRYVSSGRVISLTQRPLPDNTQHS
jgi:hypothetical protein